MVTGSVASSHAAKNAQNNDTTLASPQKYSFAHPKLFTALAAHLLSILCEIQRVISVLLMCGPSNGIIVLI